MRIVVVGAGFAGLRASIELKKNLKDSEIIVINNGDFSVFVPGLVNLVSGQLKEKDIVIDLKKNLSKKGIRFINSKVTGIDSKSKKVFSENKNIQYDFLVLSIGYELNTFKIKGVEENCFTLTNIKSALKLKKQLSELKNGSEVVVIGGGINGVQTASGISGLLGKKANVSVVEAKSKLASELPKVVSRIVERMFEKQGIKSVLNTSVLEVKKDRIITDKGEIKSDTSVWLAGLKPNSLFKKSGLKFRNGIIVDKNFRTSDPSIFAVGDCIEFDDAETDSKFLRRGQTAFLQGIIAGKNIARLVHRKKMIEYKPQPIPTVVYLKGKPLMQFRGIVIRGRIVKIIEKAIRLRHVKFYMSRINTGIY